MVLATLEWSAILISAGVGALLSVILGLLAFSVLQDPVDRFIATMWGWFRRENPKALPLDGIWRSRYEYTSSDAPEVSLIDEHFCQFELAPTRDRADGLWTGFSRGRGVLAGPWTIQRVTYDRRRRTRRGYEGRSDLNWGTPVGVAPATLLR